VTSSEVLALAADHGVRVFLSPTGGLKFGCRGALPDALRAVLVVHKPALVALLTAHRLFDECDAQLEALLPPGPLRRHPDLLAAVAAVPELGTGNREAIAAACDEVAKIARRLAEQYRPGDAERPPGPAGPVGPPAALVHRRPGCWRRPPKRSKKGPRLVPTYVPLGPTPTACVCGATKSLDGWGVCKACNARWPLAEPRRWTPAAPPPGDPPAPEFS
jgi:hypothetical protein